MENILVEFEKLHNKKRSLSSLPGNQEDVFFFDFQKYKGKAFALSDGTKINTGDLVAELHLANLNMKNYSGLSRKQLQGLLDTHFKLLSLACKTQVPFSEVKAFYGRTILYPLLGGRGFEIKQISSFYLRHFLKLWDNLLKMAFGSSPSGRIKFRESKEIWITPSALYKIGKNKGE